MNKSVAHSLAIGIVILCGAVPALAKTPNPDVVLATMNGPKQVHVTESTSPGEAFYPDGAVGDPKRACLFAGGTPQRHAGADGTVIWRCL